MRLIEYLKNISLTDNNISLEFQEKVHALTLFDFSEQHFSFELLLTPNLYILILTFGIMDYYERKTTKVSIDKYLGKQNILHRYFFYYLLCLFSQLNPKDQELF